MAVVKLYNEDEKMNSRVMFDVGTAMALQSAPYKHYIVHV